MAIKLTAAIRKKKLNAQPFDVERIQWDCIEKGQLSESDLQVVQFNTVSLCQFIPDASILDALKTAAASGVEIQLMIPGIKASFFLDPVTNYYSGQLLEYGTKVYKYQGYIHAPGKYFLPFCSIDVSDWFPGKIALHRKMKSL